MGSGVDGTVVIKIGGAVLDDLRDFWPLVREWQRPVIVVHGGGTQSTALANRLGLTPQIVQGRQVTTDLDLTIAEWTLCGEVNVQLVSQACAGGLRAVGLSGVDGNLIRVRRREPWTIEGRIVDFGWVGENVRINPLLLTALQDSGFTPIISPVSADAAGQRFNVNADTVAGAIASNIKAESLLM